MTAVSSDVHPARRPRRARLRRSLQAGALSLAFALAGCSSSDYDDLDAFGWFEEDPPPPETEAAAEVRERANVQSAAAQDEETPSLTSVPDRPDPGSSAARERVLEGLVADRANARYTDEAIRLQEAGTPPEPPTSPPADPARDESAAPPAAPVVEAPTTPAPTSTSDEAAAPTTSAPPPPPAAGPAARMAPPPPKPAGPPAAEGGAGATRPSQTSSAVTVDPSAIDGSSRSAPVYESAEKVATIQFAHGSANLDSRDRQVLAAVASAQQGSGDTVLVVGHASRRTQQLDRASHESANFEISIARASAVAQALIDAGIARDKVRIEAAGDDAPIYVEAMPSGEAGNRRADVYFIR